MLSGDMRKLIAAAVGGLAMVAAGACSAKPESSAVHPPTGSSATTPARPANPSTTTTTVPPTTTSTIPIPLPVPTALIPIVGPALAGEGSWRPGGPPLPGGYGIYTTVLRPGAGLPESGIAWIDTKAVYLSLYAGSTQPYGKWPQQSDVGPTARAALMAAFNSGFKIYDYHTGWYDQGRSAVPLQAGFASLVIYSNGTATVGDWGRDVTMGPGILAVRQNLPLLVDHGAPVNAAQYPSQWGAVLGGGSVTWRSAVGVTAAGEIIYAGGPDLTPERLARLMVAAGAERAMQLDINPEWVSFSTFSHASGITSGTNLLPGMYSSPSHYFTPYARDFFAIFAR
jgi:hypothetical protein